MKVLPPVFADAVNPNDTFLVICCSRHNDVKQIIESAKTQEQGHAACTVLGKHERKIGGRSRFIVRRKTDIQIIDG